MVQSGVIYLEWDESKAESNLRKHGVDFEDAALVFNDPYRLSEPDRIVDGELRWRTIGTAGEIQLFYVAHMSADHGFDELIRIVSARPATRKERKFYGQNRQENAG